MRRRIKFIRRHGRSLFLCLVVGASLSTVLLAGPSAQAHTPTYPDGPHLTMNPNPYGYIPTDVYKYLTHANLYQFTPAYLHWISGPYPASTTITVTDGQQTAEALKLNLSAVVGYTPSSALRTKSQIHRITTAGVTRPNGQSLEGAVQTIDFGAGYNTAGTYEYTYNDFLFLPPGGFTKDKYTITFFTKSITEFTGSPKYRCVAEPRNSASSLTDFNACNEAGWQLDIYVNRVPQGDYSNSIVLQSKPLQGSPTGGEVTKGPTYSLFPKVSNAGPFKTFNQQYMVVQNQNSDKVSNVAIDPLTPSGNRDSIFGVYQQYNPNNTACSTSGTIENDCWFWPFKDLNKDNSVQAEFRFKVKSTANAGDQVCFRPFVRRQSLDVSVNIGDRICYTVVDPPTCPVGSDFAGQLVSTLTEHDGEPGITAGDCYLPQIKSYMQVFGNDVIAGGGFGSPCTLNNPTAKIDSYNKSTISGGNTNWTGSSGQFLVSALGRINGFFSANKRNAATFSPMPPLDLTLGNSSNGNNKVAPEQGGDSGASNNCIPDYFAKNDTLQQATTIGLSLIPNGVHVAMYYDHDVYISADVKFQNAESDWGNSVNNIPSLYVIVRGNIYIAPGVTQLDGVYIAQPKIDPVTGDLTKGEIITCAIDSSGTFTTPVHGGCANKLTINGTFIAKKVKFKREFGDLDTAVVNEDSSNTKAAEVFNFSPEVYLSPLHPTLTRSVPFTKYDYITSLPPIL